MARVTGLGGLFYKVADPDAARKWYLEKLGLGGDWGAMFAFRDDSADGFSLLTPFAAESDHFAPSKQDFMINLRVDDLDAFVDEIETKGVEIIGRHDDEYGRFAWIVDPDGIKVELYQQPQYQD